MTTRLKILVSLILSLLSLDILSRFLEWMNRPSDAWFYAGALGALALMVVVPGILGAIWRGYIDSQKRP